MGDVAEQKLPQGWFHDPYGIHQDRYFSAGRATKLVRDGRRESYDPPPDRPQPELVLVSAESGEPGDATDLRRADDASTKPYRTGEAIRAALDVFDRTNNW
jgi:hypothetical protein